MFRRWIGVIRAVRPSRRDGNVRLREHDIRLREIRQALEHLAAPRREHRAAEQRKRDVRAELRAERAELLVTHTERVELIHAAQDRRCIRAAARKAGRHRDALFERDCHAARDAIRKRLLHEPRRAHGEISFIRLQPRHVNRQLHARLGCFLQTQRVRELDGLHDHRDFVKTVRPRAEDVERQIDLRVSEDGYVLQESNTSCILYFILFTILSGFYRANKGFRLSTAKVFSKLSC